MRPAESAPILDRLARSSAQQWLFALLAIAIVAYTFSLDRSGMIDQQNYEDYFTPGVAQDWLSSLVLVRNVVDVLSVVILDEPLWRAWTFLLSGILDPTAATYLTVAVLNGLVALAVRGYRYPVVAMAAWLVIPLGFSVIGVYQIRQGLAFAIWLMVAIRWNRLVVGTLIAGLFHSTFLVVAPMAFLASRRSVSVWMRVLLIALFAIGVSVAGRALFETLGGRRIEAYLYADETFSAAFVVAAVALLAYPLWLTRSRRVGSQIIAPSGPALSTYGLLYAGVLVYLVTCFFLFPLGMYRVNYLLALGLIPIVGNVSFSSVRAGKLPDTGVLVGSTVVAAYCTYLLLAAIRDNRYACVLSEHCAAILTP
jgi:hypothetical protein